MKKRRPYGMYVTGQRPASAHLYLEVFRIASDAFFGRGANRWDLNWSKEIELTTAGCRWGKLADRSAIDQKKGTLQTQAQLGYEISGQNPIAVTGSKFVVLKQPFRRRAKPPLARRAIHSVSLLRKISHKI